MTNASSLPHVDVAVVGAGPAGLAAATLLAEAGLSVEVLDERPHVGGHRFCVEGASDALESAADRDDHAHWAALVAAFDRSGARHTAGAKVWAVDRECSATTASDANATESAGTRHNSLAGRAGVTLRGDGWDVPSTVPMACDGLRMSVEGSPRLDPGSNHHTATTSDDSMTLAESSPPVNSGLRVAISVAGVSTSLIARKLVIATGAQERPFPIPGGTLDGVTDASAMHDALNAGAMLSGPIALAGCGPLLYASAARLLRTGVEVVAILDTLQRTNFLRALPYAVAFMRSPYFKAGGELLRYVNERVKIMRGVTRLEAIGNRSLAAIRFAGPAMTGELAVSTLVLHHGLVPGIQLAAALGSAHEWNEAERCWYTRSNAWGATSVPDVHVVGDAAALRGAAAAESTGRLCALALASELGAITPQRRDAEGARHRRALADAVRGRRFLMSLYAPPEAFRLPSANTVVCRCESITAREVRSCVREGCTGANQLKAFSRCGMGPCQGRGCALTVTELMADERGVHPADVGHFRVRFPLSPISLGELASMPRSAADEAAVHSSHMSTPVPAAGTDH